MFVKGGMVMRTNDLTNSLRRLNLPPKNIGIADGVIRYLLALVFFVQLFFAPEITGWQVGMALLAVYFGGTLMLARDPVYYMFGLNTLVKRTRIKSHTGHLIAVANGLYLTPYGQYNQKNGRNLNHYLRRDRLKKDAS